MIIVLFPPLHFPHLWPTSELYQRWLPTHHHVFHPSKHSHHIRAISNKQNPKSAFFCWVNRKHEWNEKQPFQTQRKVCRGWGGCLCYCYCCWESGQMSHQQHRPKATISDSLIQIQSDLIMWSHSVCFSGDSSCLCVALKPVSFRIMGLREEDH